MDIFPIFEIEDHFITHLWTSEYDNCDMDEFAETFKNWSDPDYLYDFFLENEKDLMSGYFPFQSLQDAIIQTQDLALQFEEILLEAAANKNEINLQLNQLFHPLDNHDYRYESDLQKTKKQEKWLRIYAIKVNPSCYVVSSSAIKLSKLMDRPHFDLVKHKLGITKNHLNENGYITFDDLIKKLE